MSSCGVGGGGLGLLAVRASLLLLLGGGVGRFAGLGRLEAHVDGVVAAPQDLVDALHDRVHEAVVLGDVGAGRHPGGPGARQARARARRHRPCNHRPLTKTPRAALCQYFRNLFSAQNQVFSLE